MKEVDVLALGAHPDDVEIGCGGILALLAAAGRRVGAVHLTRGEAGTRGTAEIRAEEAAAAARVLGMEHEILDFGDGGLRTGRTEEDRLLQTLREACPEIVLLPSAPDRHPDHERAAQLGRDCCFYAGLGKRADPLGLPPHRPRLVLHYLLHDQRAPDVIVDVGAVFERKLEALRAYASQLTIPGNGPEERAGDPTWVASGVFGQALVARARHFGAQIGVEYGEGLCARGPLALHDLQLLAAAIPASSSSTSSIATPEDRP